MHRLIFLTVFLLLALPCSSRDLDERTNHVFGFIPRASIEQGGGMVKIFDANAIPANLRLPKPRPNDFHELKITLDRFEISGYPGWGQLNLLFVFSAQDQISIDGQSLDKAQLEALTEGMKLLGRGEAVEAINRVVTMQKLYAGSKTVNQPVKYTHLYQIREGDGMAVNGYPVFIGLRSGEEGAAFRVSIIYLDNRDDLDLVKKVTDKVSKGLNLMGPYGQLVSTVTGQVEGIVEHIKARDQNKIIQDIFLGLDHSSLMTRAKLAEGSYVVVQIDHDPSLWDWNKWEFDTRNGQIVRAKSEPPKGYLDTTGIWWKKKKDSCHHKIKERKMDYNYVVFGVSEMTNRSLAEVTFKKGDDSAAQVLQELRERGIPYRVDYEDSAEKPWITYQGETYDDLTKFIKLLQGQDLIKEARAKPVVESSKQKQTQ